MESVRWLYVPCVVLILASYAIDFAVRRRSAYRDHATSDADSSPHREQQPGAQRQATSGQLPQPVVYPAGCRTLYEQAAEVAGC